MHLIGMKAGIAAIILGIVCCGMCSGEVLSPGDYRREVVEARLRRLGPRGPEGLWLLTGGNTLRALIAIERYDDSEFDAGTYRIVVVEAEDRSIVPGTVIGSVTAVARKDQFDASIASEIRHGRPLRHKAFTLTLLDSGDRLEISRRSEKLKINFYAALPYLFVRPSITTREGARTQPPAPGAIRLFPKPLKPVNPVYL